MKSSANILVCVDDRTAGQEAAERLVCAAVRAVAERGVFCVAVPGGSSPRAMYEALGGLELRDIVPWPRVELFFTDERCVPPESDQSNYRMLSDLLLSSVPIPSANIHRMRGEDEPESAAAQYEEELHRVMGSNPSFDLIVLGMGTDTHTASLFPDSPALQEYGRHVTANYVDKLQTYRLTLTLPVINRAEQVIMLAFGPEKADALTEVLQGPEDRSLHPAQAVRPASGRLLWIVDQLAAAKL